MILTVDNTAGFLPVGSVDLNAALPAGVTIGPYLAVGGNVGTTSCGGTLSAVSADGAFTLAGGAVAASSTCQITVPVTSTTIGLSAEVTGSLLSAVGGSTLTSVPGSGQLDVIFNPQGSVTFVQNSSDDGIFSFNSSEGSLNFSITTVSGTGTFGPVSVAFGTYVVTQSRPAGVGNTAVTCSDGDSVVDAATGTITLNVDPLEDVVCTFNSLTTANRTSEIINSFLNRRNNFLLTNGPDLGRRLERLAQGDGSAQKIGFQQGDLGSLTPFTFDFLTVGSGSYKFSTSINQMRRARAMIPLALDGDTAYKESFTPSAFDVWLELKYNEFNASQGSGGHFGIAYLGADYLFNEDLLAGFLIQYDTLKDSSDVTSSTIEGEGWLMGPYVTARIAPNLIFDGRIAYGQSTNDVSPFNTYTDEFKTDRWLVDASLSGSYEMEDWQVTPNVGLSYVEEKQHAYTDSLNVLIPEQTVSLGQFKFGPTFSTSYHTGNMTRVEPRFSINGIYNFGDRDGPLIATDTADETNGWRARLDASVVMTNEDGIRFEFGANYDGIGTSDYEAWGASVKIMIPFN